MKKLLATLIVLSAFAVTSAKAATILANDDIFVETSSDGTVTTTYNGYVPGGQVAFGLAAANGIATGRRRSFIEFTIGPDPVVSATFMIYNYWGANMGGGSNPAGNGQIRLRATPVGTPVTFTEPALSIDTTYVPPTDAQFNSTLATITVSTIGWQTIDVTSWYNARLGQTTTLQIHGVQTGGFDFPIFEDREGTAFLNGSDNTIANSGPMIVTVIPEPGTFALASLGAASFLVLRRKQRA